MANSSNETLAQPIPLGIDVIVAIGVTGAVAALTCTAALVLIPALKLHRKLVYRLAAYQVSTSLAFAVANLLNLAAVDYHRGNYTLTDNAVCRFVAFARMYTVWTKLLAAVLVTLHLYCYVVCYRNLKKCEAVYVLVFVLLPVSVSVVPFATTGGSYGPDRQWCWITPPGTTSEPLKLILWFGPAVLLLSLVSAAVAYMTVVLFRRGCLERKDEFYTAMKQRHRKLCKHLLPLLAYPVLFLVLLVPLLVIQMLGSRQRLSDPLLLEILNIIFTSLLSTSAGLTLIWHVIYFQCTAKKKTRSYQIE